MLTIAANLTKELPPVILNQCLKKTMICFLLQVFASFFFCYEYLHFSAFQPFDFMLTLMRFISTLLLHLQMQKKMYNSMRLLNYLKNMRQTKN